MIKAHFGKAPSFAKVFLFAVYGVALAGVSCGGVFLWGEEVVM
ncbi:hypothetical protein [Capnocytophaga bilenii]|jgi:lipoprotein